jgi:hypothetical protein
MRRLLAVCLITSLLAMIGGCKAHRGAAITGDACSLISKEEIEAVQNVPVKEAKSSEHLDGIFRVTLCLYTASEFSRSVSLELIQPDQKQRNAHTPKDFWKEKFDPYRNEEPKTNRGDQKEQGPAPKKIASLGDDAYWVPSRFGGTLYVLKGNVFISIGLGGTDDEETKLKKSEALAQKALQRL